MKAGSINLQKIFEQTIRYRVPLFQRPYVWDLEPNWEPLWDAIRVLAERHLRKGKTSPYFLGAIVLDHMPGQTGFVESRQVIDGQQRLTTLQLMLAALRDLAVYYELPLFASRFAKLTTNDAAFVATPDDAFKVWPTNCDRDAFRKTMTAGSEVNLYTAFGVPYDQWTGSQIPDAYLYFWDVLQEWIEEDNPVEPDEDLSRPELEARLEALWTTIRTQLQLVAIDLEADDDAQVIFETLNNYGTQLLPADLVKNFLFREAENNGANAEELNTRFWKRFEEDFWRKETRQGRIKRPRIDLFLQHYLTLKTLEEVPVSHVFTYYRTYVEDTIQNGTAQGHAEGPAAFHLEQLQTYGRIFRQFLTAKPESRKGLFFDRLAAVDTATVYPLLLEAFHDLNEPDSRAELRRLVADIESFLIRRMICGLTTKGYNRLFLEMVRACRKGGKFSVLAGREFLQRQEGDSGRWPDNKELREAMLTRPLYRTLSQAKLRMVFLAIERQLEDGETEPVEYTDKKNFTIEHVMPRAWQKNWPLPKPQSSADDKATLSARREKLIHTVGNLTLLTGKLNPKLSARGWDDKKKEIITKSKMNLNRASFFKAANWNEESIESRSRALCKLAARIWRYPSASPASSSDATGD
jgi:hypothetical protein